MKMNIDPQNTRRTAGVAVGAAAGAQVTLLLIAAAVLLVSPHCSGLASAGSEANGASTTAAGQSNGTSRTTVSAHPPIHSTGGSTSGTTSGGSSGSGSGTGSGGSSGQGSTSTSPQGAQFTVGDSICVPATSGAKQCGQVVSVGTNNNGVFYTLSVQSSSGQNVNVTVPQSTIDNACGNIPILQCALNLNLNS